MSVFSAIATGLKEGVDGYAENTRRAAIADREEKRFGWETAEQDEKQRKRDAEKDYATELDRIREEADTGRLPGVDLTPEGQAAVQGASQKSDESYARAEDRRFGINPQDAAQQPGRMAADASATQDKPVFDFKSGGVGLYANQKQADDVRYKRIYDVTAKYLANTGQQDKLFDLQKRVTEMRESGYEPMRKSAAAALAMGDPNAIRLVAKVGEVVGAPYQLNPEGSTFDKDTQTYKGVKVTGPDGQTVTRDLSAVQLMAGMGQLSAEKAVEFHFGRKDTEAGLKIKQQSADADTTKANAYATTARDNAATNASTRAANNDIRQRAQSLKEDESAAKLFNGSFGVKDFEVKTKDEVDALMPKQREDYAKARAEHEKRREVASYAQSLYTLNERRLNPATIVAAIPMMKRRIAEGKGADGIDEASGLPYLTINGKKMLVPKD